MHLLSSDQRFFSLPTSSLVCQVLSGTDLFLPVFMLVLARAQLRCPYAWCLFLRGCCSPQQMKEEAGFYITTFEAALNYLVRPLSAPVASCTQHAHLSASLRLAQTEIAGGGATEGAGEGD